MRVATLEQVELLADSLSPVDQLRLIQRLAPKIAKAVGAESRTVSQQSNTEKDAWQYFFEIGDAIAEGDSEELPTLTSTLQTMRR